MKKHLLSAVFRAKQGISREFDKNAVQKKKSTEYAYTLRGDGTAEITRYIGKNVELEIPAKLDEKRVTSIGSGAFSGCEGLINMIIPDSVIQIGEEAFLDCTGLTRITIPDGVTQIEKDAFANCTSLTMIVGRGSYAEQYAKDNGVNYMYPDSSNYRYTLREDDTVEITGYSGEAEKLIIPAELNGKRVTSIGRDSHVWCESSRSVTIPDSVIEIRSNPFAECDKLTEIRVASNASAFEVIDGVLFSKQDKRLVCCPCGFEKMSYEAPRGTKIIGEGAFSWCDNLTSITVSDSVTKICRNAFLNCTSLTSIELPDSVIEIDNGAFLFCLSLASVKIPDSVRRIGDAAFDGCDDLIMIVECGSYAEQYAKDNGFNYMYPDSLNYRYILRGDGTVEITGYYGKAEELIIPEELYGRRVTSIGSGSGFWCEHSRSVTIPDSVIEIRSNPFTECDTLTDMRVASNASAFEVIDGVLFSKQDKRLVCYPFGFKKASYEVPKGTKVIGEGAFSWCRLTSITISDSVTKICRNAFLNCTSLTSIELPDSVIEIDSGAFVFCDSLTNIELPDSVVKIGCGAFGNCFSLASVKIPGSVRRIGDGAFADCDNLTVIVERGSYAEQYAKDNGINYMYPDSLNYRYTLREDNTVEITGYMGEAEELIMPVEAEELIIPEKLYGKRVTSIGSNAFYWCKSLIRVTIPESVIEICGNPFSSCEHLTDICVSPNSPAFEVIEGVLFSKRDKRLVCYPRGFKKASYKIPSGIKIIGEGAFCCVSLTSIEISDDVVRIGSSAFSSCSGLTCIRIPDSVRKIGSNAFSYCSGLASITIPDGVQKIDDRTFIWCARLSSITIPDSVIEIGANPFVGCDNLMDISVSPNSPALEVVDGVLFSKQDKRLVRYPSTLKNSSYEIPKGTRIIDEYAFFACRSLSSITLPDSVTEIGIYAFLQCNGLKGIAIPDSVIQIGGRAFFNTNDWIIMTVGHDSYAEWYAKNHYIRRIIYPESMGYDCFQRKDGTVEIGGYAGKAGALIIPAELNGKRVTRIGGRAFAWHSELTSITIPDSVTEIGKEAFVQCENLTSVMIPDGVTQIDYGAFRDCTSLTSITIPNSVTEIGEAAFLRCESLSSIIIPDGVTQINYGTFGECTSLTSITIPDSVTVIGEAAFWRCESLSSIIIPDGVTKIAKGAFVDCTSLTSITIPDSVTEIEAYAFNRRNNLTIIVNYGSYAEQYARSYCGNCIYPEYPEYMGYYCIRRKDDTMEIKGYAGKAGELIIPAELNGKRVTRIGSGAFIGGSGLTSITIPDSVTEIGKEAFARCENLTSIMIPDSVTQIARETFGECTSLTSITIPDSVTKIGEFAFSCCKSITSIIIPEGVTQIAWGAFSNCASLASITIPDSVTEIGKEAFVQCENLTSVMIPDGVTQIAWRTFSDCTSLSSITISDSVTKIGEQAFLRCESLTSIIIPDGVTQIAWEAFRDCTSLTSITIPDSVTEIDADAFKSCDNLTIIVNHASYAERYARDHRIKYLYADSATG